MRGTDSPCAGLVERIPGCPHAFLPGFAFRGSEPVYRDPPYLQATRRPRRRYRPGGIPVCDPTWTVIELETGREHGPFDDPADVALCLAFGKLNRDRVEVLCDAPVTASITAWI